MKGSAVVETMVPAGLEFYARFCGQTLARAHARSGDPIAIAAYLGKKDRFDQSITDFSERYADQNELDYEAFSEGNRHGRLEARRRRLGTRDLRPWISATTTWMLDE